jgi:hypothetical protein
VLENTLLRALACSGATTCCFGYETQLKVVSAVLSGTVPSIPLCREHCKEWINPDNEISVIAKKPAPKVKRRRRGEHSITKGKFQLGKQSVIRLMRVSYIFF